MTSSTKQNPAVYGGEYQAELAKKARRICAMVDVMEKRASMRAALDAYQSPYIPAYSSAHIPTPKPPISYNSNGSLFSGNPRQFNQAWDLVEPKNYSWMAPPHRMTFGESMGVAGRGLGKQIGNYAQMAFTGHNGGSSIMGNLASDAFNTATGHPPSWQGFKQDFTEPWRRALTGGQAGGLREAWRQTGMPGEWLSSQVMPNYQAIKGMLFGNSPK